MSLVGTRPPTVDEWTIIDDGSIDNTQEYIENFMLFVSFSILLFWAFQKELLDESENIRFGKTIWKATKVVAVFSFLIEFTQLLFHKLNRYGILMFKVMCSGYIWEE